MPVTAYITIVLCRQRHSSKVLKMPYNGKEIIIKKAEHTLCQPSHIRKELKRESVYKPTLVLLSSSQALIALGSD